MDHLIDDSDRLKPCPFCGGAAEMDCVRSEAGDDPNEGGYFIACLACDCSTGLRFACGEDPRPLLVEAWNRLAPEGLTFEVSRPRRRHDDGQQANATRRRGSARPRG